MRIGGFQRLSLVDYPGKIASIVFTQGCNFRCGYCHNPSLVYPSQFQVPMEEFRIFEFLESRQGKIEGVVVTGGEPTIQKGLLEFLAKLKRMGFAVKLDTNGSNPDILKFIIGLHLVDYIAMDIKTSLPCYEKVIGVRYDIKRIKSSIEVISKSGLPYQFRTTLVKSYCSEDDLLDIQLLIGATSNYALQMFVSMPNIADKQLLSQEQYDYAEVQDLRRLFQRRK